MDDEIELDIAAAFGATHVQGQRFAIYIYGFKYLK